MSNTEFAIKLTKKLRKRTSLLTDEEVAFAVRMTLKLLRESFGDYPSFNDQSMERIVRWNSLRAKCELEREKRGLSLKDVSVRLKIPQYRLKAIECGDFAAFKPELAREYFHFLGIDNWINRWRRVNRELSVQVGLFPRANRSLKR